MKPSDGQHGMVFCRPPWAAWACCMLSVFRPPRTWQHGPTRGPCCSSVARRLPTVVWPCSPTPPATRPVCRQHATQLLTLKDWDERPAWEACMRPAPRTGCSAAARRSTGIATVPPHARARGLWHGVGLWSSGLGSKSCARRFGQRAGWYHMQRWLANTTAPVVACDDRWRLNFVVYGATVRGEAPECDAILVSPIRHDGNPVDGASARDGVALATARRRKLACYPS